MNNAKLAVVLAILGIVALGYGVNKFLAGQDVEFTLKCLETKEIFTMKLPANTEFPYENPKTKAKSLYKADPFFDEVKQQNVYMIPEKEEILPSMTPGVKAGAKTGTTGTVKPPVVEEPEDK